MISVRHVLPLVNILFVVNGTTFMKYLMNFETDFKIESRYVYWVEVMTEFFRSLSKAVKSKVKRNGAVVGTLARNR